MSTVGALSQNKSHISVCVCTYKRPEYLGRLLSELSQQVTDDVFTYSIVVVDNDCERSAEAVVRNFAAGSAVSIEYCVEPQQNIALARNQAVTHAKGDFIAFIDDDEFPTARWLGSLLKTIHQFEADGVLGPVKPHFTLQPPRWIVEGHFHDRPMHATGSRLDWNYCRTGNVLFKRRIFLGQTQPFRPECLSGEDQNFFRRMIERGHSFTWCNDAVVYEIVQPGRCKRRFLIKRALVRGVYSLRNHGFPPARILRSFIATPAYAAALPVTLFFGQARFMLCMFKLTFHIGRLLAVLGINPIRKYAAD